MYFISHTATAYQMDKNVIFFSKRREIGSKKGNKGYIYGDAYRLIVGPSSYIELEIITNAFHRTKRKK